MGDGESSSGGDTIVIDHGRRRSSCGYCRSTTYTSISHGLWAHKITADDYQELLDRGWRRSGCFLYKPEMDKTCCPSYTIRLKAGDFVHSKEQLRVCKKMQRFLDGTIEVKIHGKGNGRQNSSMGLFSLAGDVSLTKLSAKESSCKQIRNEDEFIDYFSNKIDGAINALVGSGQFPCTIELPKAVVRKVTPQAKRKLVELSGDLLYTSNISFQIAAVLRNSQSAGKDIDQAGLISNGGQKEQLMSVTPNIVSEKLAYFLEQHQEPSGFLIRACNGHLNFYSTTKESSSMLTNADDACTKASGNSKRSLRTETREVLPQKKRKLEIRTKRSSFDPEEFALYRKYQIKVHDDKPEKVTESSYRRFLVDTPIIYVPPCSGNETVPPSGFGSFHQQYIIDGKLIAVGVVDILPRCLSSKYLFWDPDLAFLSLGKYSALQEINWVHEAQAHCPTLQHYYLGYYIHTCSKMRYKAAYCPSELLCPLRYKWVPFDIARPFLDEKSYVILSDCVAQHVSTHALGTPIGQPGSCPDQDDPNEASSDDEGSGLDHRIPDKWLDDESSPESFSTSVVDNLQVADISNIVIDLNGSRVKFKDVQKVFGPIEKRHITELEMQLLRYVKAVGMKLSSHMIYSLG